MHCSKSITSISTTQRRIKSNAVNYIVINDIQFFINTQKRLTNITPNILLVIPEKLEPVILHTTHKSLLALHQGAWKTFLTKHKNYYMHYMLAKKKCSPKHVMYAMAKISSH